MMNSKWYGPLTWLLRILIAGFVVERLLAGNFVDATALSLFLLLSFGYLLRQEHLPNLFDVLVATSALLNAFGFVFSLYKEIPFYDNVAHALTIFAVTLAFFYLIYRDSFDTTRGVVMATAVFTFGVTIGALWEVMEWTAELVLDANVVFGLDDTMTDLITNTVGALAAALIALIVRHHRATSEERLSDQA